MARQPKRRSSSPKARLPRWPSSKAQFEELTEQALVDAYGEDEQRRAGAGGGRVDRGVPVLGPGVSHPARAM
jgi:hypothetical protein